MADNKHPDFLSDDDMDLITSDDPQATLAGRGWKQLGNTAAAQPSVQKALDFHGNLKSYNDLVTNALLGDSTAMQALSERSLGTAMGSIKVVESEAPAIGEALNDVKQATPYSPSIGTTLNDIKQAGPRNQFGKVTWLKGEEPSGDFGKIVVKEAEGGMIPDVSTPEFIPDQEMQPAHMLPDFIPDDQFVGDEDKYGSTSQQLKAGLEGAAQGLVGPLAPMAEKAFGVKEEDIRGRAEMNPATHYAGEIAGLVGPALLTGGASTAARSGAEGLGLLAKAAKFTQAGALDAIGSKLGLEAGSTLASRIGAGAAKAAIDNMLIAGSDETSRMILNDPYQSAESAIQNIGLAGVIGGTLGGVVGGAAHAWEAKSGTKLAQTIEDFKARVREHQENPNPVDSVRNEMHDYYSNIKSSTDEVYGPQGLKAQEIAKLMPEEMTPKIQDQAQGISDKLESTFKKMVSKPDAYPSRLTSKIQGDMNAYLQVATNPEASPGQLFNAAQDLKQQLQSYAKFDKFVKPVDEAYDFVRDSKSLAHELRTSLEDSSVWGKAAERQQAINKAFKEYLPALQDFEKKFTVEVGGEKQVDPGKINTYMNQLGKSSAEIKQQMLNNFMKASEKYKEVIGETHANLGIDSPIKSTPINSIMSTLKEKTLGSRMADMFIDKGLSEGGSKAIGATVGGAAGHMVGHAGIGALIGAHTLGPFFSSVLPALAKATLGAETSAVGFRNAVEYGTAAAKGEMMAVKAAKNVFKAESAVLPEALIPGDKERIKLNKLLDSIKENPEVLLKNVQNNNLKLLPEHDLALNQTSASAVNYLNSLRSNLDKKGPLDAKPVASTAQKASFNNALNIAQQPLVVLSKVKDGTVTAEDVGHLMNMYPALYQGLKQKVTTQMVDAINKGEAIPYKSRIGLSVFLAEPLDSSMQPASIMAAQPLPQQPAVQPSVPKGRPSSPALSKIGQGFQTPGQAREARSQRAK